MCPYLLASPYFSTNLPNSLFKEALVIIEFPILPAIILLNIGL